MRDRRLAFSVSAMALAATAVASLCACSSGVRVPTPAVPPPAPLTFPSTATSSGAVAGRARTLVAVAGRTPPRILLLDARTGSGVATLALPAAPVALRGRYVVVEAGRLASSTGLLGTFDTLAGRLTFTPLRPSRPTGLLVARTFGLVLTDAMSGDSALAERFPVALAATAGPSPVDDRAEPGTDLYRGGMPRPVG